MEAWRKELYHHKYGDVLCHEGKPKRSGRFPWGSGENPFHHTGNKLRSAGKLEEKRRKELGKLKDYENKSREKIESAKQKAEIESEEKAIKFLKEERKRVDEGRDNSNKKERHYKEEKKALDATSKIAKGASDIYKKKADSERNAMKVKMDLSNMTNQELQARIQRYNLEKTYKNISVENVKTGNDRVSELLSTIGSVTEIASSAVELASAFRELRGK